MEFLIRPIVMGREIGLISDWIHDDVLRDQHALWSLRDLAETQKERINRRKAT